MCLILVCHLFFACKFRITAHIPKPTWDGFKRKWLWKVELTGGKKKKRSTLHHSMGANTARNILNFPFRCSWTLQVDGAPPQAMIRTRSYILQLLPLQNKIKNAAVFYRNCVSVCASGASAVLTPLKQKREIIRGNEWTLRGCRLPAGRRGTACGDRGQMRTRETERKSPGQTPGRTGVTVSASESLACFVFVCLFAFLTDTPMLLL